MLKKTTKMEIGEVVEQRSERAKSANFPVLSVSNSQGFIRQEEQFLNRKVASENTENYKVVYKNDYAYNPARINVGSLARFKNEDRGIVSPMYVVFSTKKMINNDYLDYYFQSENFKKQMRILLSGSVRQTLDFSALSNIIINLPNEAEQAKIGAFLSAIDRLIEKQKEKVDRIKTLKNSYLQKMFPVDGQHEPRIRFSNSLGKWKELTFGEIAEYKKGPFGSALVKALFLPKGSDTVKVYEQQNAIKKNDKLERYFISKDYAMKMKSFEVHSGDIIVSCAGTIGEFFILPETAEIGIINQALMRVRVKETIVLKAFFQYVFSEMVVHFSQVHSNGSAIKNIPPFSDLKPKKVRIPQLEEQYKIVALLGGIDRLIEKEEASMKRYESLKKAYLQKLFADQEGN